MKRLLLASTLVAFAAVAALFVVQPGATDPDPVAFDDTVRMGLSNADLREAQFQGHEIPRAQVFYSQFSFVVGFTGLESFARSMQSRRYERIWGRPVQAYVTDFSGTEPSPAEDGFVDTTAPPSWTEAAEAQYVVGAGALLPFSDRGDAAEYADDHGGELKSFEELMEHDLPEPDVYGAAEEVVDERSRQADEDVEELSKLLERDVSVTVGKGGSFDTVQEAVDTAPNDTAVYVGSGVYEEHVTVDRPLTLVGGSDAHLRGHGNGTVVKVESDQVAVTGFELSGVGEYTRETPGDSDAEERWDRTIEEAYGGTNAAVRVVSSDDVLVRDVSIDTTSTGVLYLDSDGAVVDTEVVGTESWGDGFMGVLAMRSPVVVENSSFHGGRDSVYVHASDGIVVRDSYMEGGRFGVHLMYTSDSFVRNNTVREAETAGVVVMTRPTGTYLVGNDVRRSGAGVITVGSRSYFAENVVVDNGNGLRMGARNSVYRRNVVARNRHGARASSVIPSNEVSENDFVDNEVQITSAEGSMRIWGYGGVGNYWSDAPPGVDEYRPTDPVDAGVTSVDGAVTFRRSPAYRAIRAIETLVPGAQRSGVVDESPLATPAVYDEMEVREDD